MKYGARRKSRPIDPYEAHCLEKLLYASDVRPPPVSWIIVQFTSRIQDHRRTFQFLQIGVSLDDEHFFRQRGRTTQAVDRIEQVIEHAKKQYDIKCAELFWRKLRHIDSQSFNIEAEGRTR